MQDLDLTKPGIRKPSKRSEFEVTTKEVLEKADFRVSNFVATKYNSRTCLPIVYLLNAR